MKLVLIPGMDGTGILFEPLIPNIKELEVLILPLPDDGPQDYRTLSEYIFNRLPQEEFILFAESFSGGIAAMLSRRQAPHLKGIIFVASFLSAPKKIVASLVSVLPIRCLANLPFTGIVYRYFFLGIEAGSKEIKLIKRAINAVSSKTLKSRLKVVAQSYYDGFTSNIPVAYIGATGDRLVSSEKGREFTQAYTNHLFLEIDGPHFILQAKPIESAAAIVTATKLISSQKSSDT